MKSLTDTITLWTSGLGLAVINVLNSGVQLILVMLLFAAVLGVTVSQEPILVNFDKVKVEKIRFYDLVNFGDEEHVGLSEVQFYEKRKP